MMVRDIMIALIGMVIVQSSLTYLHCFFVWIGFLFGKEEKMVIKRVLTNNAVVVEEDGIEKIVCGKGIAYKKRSGMEIDISLVNQTFILEENSKHHFEDLLKDVPLPFVEIAHDIVDQAKMQLAKQISDVVILTLSDHIYAATQRIKEGVEIHNSLLWEIQNYYELEYEIGKNGIQMIHDRLNVDLPDDEAGFIALHIVNAQINGDHEMDSAYKITKLIQEITTIVRYFYSTNFDSSDIYYYRFLTHLKFFAIRMFSGKVMDSNDLELLDVIKEKYSLAHACVLKIKDFLMQKYDYLLTDEELMYLTIHVHRVVNKAANKNH